MLFHPSDAMRSVSRGVAIDYYLKQAAGKVTIEILDAQGKTITTFMERRRAPAGRAERAAARRRPSPKKERRADAAAVRRRVSSARQGMNRFTWDMRYPNARDFPGMILWAATSAARRRRPVTISVQLTRRRRHEDPGLRDPRNAAVPGVTDADLQEQFKLAKQISDKVTAANDDGRPHPQYQNADRRSDRQDDRSDDRRRPARR